MGKKKAFKPGSKTATWCVPGTVGNGGQEAFYFFCGCPPPLFPHLPQEACEMYKLDPRLEDGMLGFKPGYSKENFRVCRYYGPTPEDTICDKLKTVHGRDVYPAVIKSRSKLQAPQSE